MPRHPRSVRRGAVYWFRAKVPADVRGHFRNAEVSYSLKTKDPAVGRERTKLASLKFDEEVAAARRVLSQAPLTELTAEHIERLAAIRVAELLAMDEGLRMNRFTFPEIEQSPQELYADHAALIQVLPLLKKRLSMGNTNFVDSDMEDFLRRHGAGLPKDSDTRRRLSFELMKATVRGWELMAERHQGEVVDTPKVEPLVAQGAGQAHGSGPTLSTAVKHFMAKADPTRPMYTKYKTVLPMFLEVVGDKPVAQLRQADVDGFCELLCKLPPRWPDIIRKRKVTVRELAAAPHPLTISPKTFEYTYIAVLRPFLEECKRFFGDQGFPGHLTTKGIDYRGTRKAGERKQREFRPDDLKRIYEGPEFAAFANDCKHPGKYWLPLIGLYTGARVNEICQLNPQADIGEEGGVWVFRFTDESDTAEGVRKSIKNETSKRTFPIHPRLLELGFLDYLDQVRATGAKLLFPHWKPAAGKASRNAERWLKRFFATIGIRDETPGQMLLGAHAFRHNLLTHALNEGIANIERITGHAGESSAVLRGYQRNMDILKKLDILKRVVFDVSPPRWSR